jgi:hypothetical protein
MSNQSLDHLLSELEAFRYRFGRNEATRVVELINGLAAINFRDPAQLIRFHETLLFLRAFPQGVSAVRAAEHTLNRLHKKVEALRAAGADMDAFDTFEFSGIAGTQMEDTLSFDVARWLVHANRLPAELEVAWENYDPGRELGNTGPRFIPLLEDDAFVEADTPWQRWLRAASGGSKNKSRKTTHSTAAWLIERFEQLQLSALQKAELYESLRVPLRWTLGNSTITRTRNRKLPRAIFYHSEPLISRSQVSLADELARRPPKFTKLSQRQGSEIIELIREVMLVRYRELYGTTLADPRSVVKAEVGRGVEIYLWNLPADRRLPLRSYVAGLTLKNGVPINYIEAIALCEWMEVGFNTFYTFRGGEAGWIYAQVLRCLCHRMGTTCVSVYPYQLGHENEEAIQSGAFWFYRKLGFRPGRVDLRKLAEREEEKINADPKYRTPARTLKRLAAEHVFYELPGSQVGAWDRFSTRNLGLRVNERMARDFAGDAVRMREHSTRALERALGMRSGRSSVASWTPLEQKAFGNFALVLADLAEVRHWTGREKEALVTVIRAKADPDEMLFLRLTQAHERLREVLRPLGS